MKAITGTLAFFSSMFLSLSCPAQTSTSLSLPDCESRSVQQKRDWGKTTHSWVENVLHKEHSDIAGRWCRIWEARGADRIPKVEDFGRTVFTGDGVHPVIGSIVPGSGLAAGLAFNLQRAAADHPIRYSTNIEARGSLNAFWTAGAKLDLVGSGNRSNGPRHNHLVFSVQHSDLPQLAYFGLGNSSSTANQSVYGLTETTPQLSFEVPVPRGFKFSALAAGLWAGPRGFHDSTTPSIEQRFNVVDTPALNTATAYAILGGGIQWECPVEQRERGYRTTVSGLFRVFHEASNGPFSFRRADVAWVQSYTPDVRRNDSDIDLGTISLVSRLVTSIAPAGNSVPFYLQPTLGGADIFNQDVLRSYHDYRFRAPHVLSFQTEYEHKIKGPLGALLFWDVGKVAQARSDLDVSHLRHSFGFGITFRTGGFPVFKLYYALGGREGSHINYTGNTNNFIAKGPLGPLF